jgi:Protein of unknown function (DUF3303)
MDFVAHMKFRPSLSAAEVDGAMIRRASYEYPEGVKLIAEYWPISSASQVVAIWSADSIDRILEMALEWDDVFEIDVHPAISAEDGLRAGPEIFARLPRLRQPA